MRKFLLLTKERQHKELANALRERDIERYLALMEALELPPPPLSTFKEIADAYHHHLQQAKLSLKEHRLLPQITTKDRPAPLRSHSLHILLDNIRSAYNVGNIIRTAEAFGLSTLIFRDTTPLPTHKQVKDAAMGADQWISWSSFTSFDALPRPLIALETSPDAIPIHSFTFPKTGTLLLGNEEYGLTDAALHAADHLITIPLFGRKNSLNVANAFAIASAQIAGNTNGPI